MHAALTHAGYQLDFGVDGTGVYGKSFRQGGGFYIDVGCASLISTGKVGLRSGRGACAVVPSTGSVAPWHLGTTLGRWVALRKGARPECPARRPGGTHAGPGRQ